MLQHSVLVHVCVFVCVIRHPHCCGYQREMMCGLLSYADVNTLRQQSTSAISGMG